MLDLSAQQRVVLLDGQRDVVEGVEGQAGLVAVLALDGGAQLAHEELVDDGLVVEAVQLEGLLRRLGLLTGVLRLLEAVLPLAEQEQQELVAVVHLVGRELVEEVLVDYAGGDHLAALALADLKRNVRNVSLPHSGTPCTRAGSAAWR